MKRIMKAAACVLATILATAEIALAQGDPVATDTAVITTTAGTIMVELYGEDAPKAVENFVKLAGSGFYRGIRFHRVIRGFVVQAGDPATRDTMRRSEWGRGGESSFGEPFEDELNPKAPSYRRGYMEGTLAMANRGPNTNTSQFFIVLNNDLQLEKLYTIFGRVISGMDVVHAIERGALSDYSDGIPRQPVVITDVMISNGSRSVSKVRR